MKSFSKRRKHSGQTRIFLNTAASHGRLRKRSHSNRLDSVVLFAMTAKAFTIEENENRWKRVHAVEDDGDLRCSFLWDTRALLILASASFLFAAFDFAPFIPILLVSYYFLVKVFFEKEKRWLSKLQQTMRNERIEEYEAWTKFHKLSPWTSRIDKGCVIEFGKFPTFRGRIRVDPPLGPDNAEVLERLQILEQSGPFRRRLDITLVAQELGISVKDATAKYGPEGEFLDYHRMKELGIDEKKQYSLERKPGQGGSPTAPPPRYLNFQYWEEDAVTGKVLVGEEHHWSTKRSIHWASNSNAVIAYLAWNFGEKTDYVVEWLAYLGEVIFKPVGRTLNGELEFQDFDSRGKIRVVNSFVSIPEPFVYEDDADDNDCDCPACKKCRDLLGPLDWDVPEPTINTSLWSNRDSHTRQMEHDILSELPKPCTWQRAAGEMLCHEDRTPYANSVLLMLPSAPPVEQVKCTGDRSTTDELTKSED